MDGPVELEVTSEEPVCDFCSSSDVRWGFPCRTFQVMERAELVLMNKETGKLSGDRLTMEVHSRGGWAACTVCKILIERGQREKLVARSAKRYKRKYPDLPISNANLIDHLRRLQDEFWQNREGPPVPLEPGQKSDPTVP